MLRILDTKVNSLNIIELKDIRNPDWQVIIAYSHKIAGIIVYDEVEKQFSVKWAGSAARENRSVSNSGWRDLISVMIEEGVQFYFL